VLIPVKRLDDAKQRLAPALTPEQRRSLMQSMVGHVVSVALEAAVGPVALASSDPAVAELGERLGVRLVSDGGLPWNEGLVHAREQLGFHRAVLYLAGDLPRLSAGEVRQLAEVAGASTAVIGRAYDAGTNALGVNPPDAMAPCFGVDRSSEVHAQKAARAWLRVVVLDLPGVAFDVDTPEDAARAGLRGG
jgi:2-phospho-L-lactate guanylyltransferase